MELILLLILLAILIYVNIKPKNYKYYEELCKIMNMNIPLDYSMMSATKKTELDIFGFTKETKIDIRELEMMLRQKDPNFPYVEGKRCSVNGYIQKKFGDRAAEIHFSIL